MYIIFIVGAMIGAYGALLLLLPLLFNSPIVWPTSTSWQAVGCIIICASMALTIAFLPSDPWWSNRLLHCIGGGVLASIMCFLAVRDSKVGLNRMQYFLVNFLIVTALGVANELAEFFLQTHAIGSFAASIDDTWLDLTSNTVGSLSAGVVLACLFPQQISIKLTKNKRRIQTKNT
jgi:glycopeptide antibiotics resistance protein